MNDNSLEFNYIKEANQSILARLNKLKTQTCPERTCPEFIEGVEWIIIRKTN